MRTHGGRETEERHGGRAILMQSGCLDTNMFQFIFNQVHAVTVATESDISVKVVAFMALFQEEVVPDCASSSLGARSSK